MWGGNGSNWTAKALTTREPKAMTPTTKMKPHPPILISNNKKDRPNQIKLFFCTK